MTGQYPVSSIQYPALAPAYSYIIRGETAGAGLVETGRTSQDQPYVGQHSTGNTAPATIMSLHLHTVWIQRHH